MVKKYTPDNKAKIVKVRCKKCGSENVTGFCIGFGEYFNIISGLMEDYTGASFNNYKNVPKYNVPIFRDDLIEDFTEITCREERDSCEAELILADGNKIDSSANNFKELMLYLIDNNAIEFVPEPYAPGSIPW
jgi:hypothetical protein